MSAEVKRKMFEIMASGDWKGYGELKASVLPDKVYKYQSINADTISSLSRGYLWAGAVTKLNDPWDSQVGFVDTDYRNKMSKHILNAVLDVADNILGLDDRDLDRIFKSAIPVDLTDAIVKDKYPDKVSIWAPYEREIYEIVGYQLDQIARFNANVNNNVKVCSLSEVNDSMTMWSHYASHHTGVCVEYRPADFIKSDFIEFYPVHYTTTLFDVGKYLGNLDIPLICSLASICKHPDWEPEKEWRFVKMGIGRGIEVKVPDPSAIIFGSECALQDPQTQEIIEIADAKSIPKRVMIKAPDRYELMPKDF